MVVSMVESHGQRSAVGPPCDWRYHPFYFFLMYCQVIDPYWQVFASHRSPYGCSRRVQTDQMVWPRPARMLPRPHIWSTPQSLQPGRCCRASHAVHLPRLGLQCTLIQPPCTDPLDSDSLLLTSTMEAKEERLTPRRLADKKVFFLSNQAEQTSWELQADGVRAVSIRKEGMVACLWGRQQHSTSRKAGRQSHT